MRMPTVLGMRSLSVEEVESLTTREAGIKARPLARLTNRHRQLARLIAVGTSPSVAAHSVGLTASHVSILQADVTFQELVGIMKNEQDAAFLGFTERMAGLAEDSVDTLRGRLEEEPDQFTNPELIDLVKTLADRTGHAPKRVEEKNVNINFGDRLDAARQRVKREALADLIIEGEKV